MLVNESFFYFALCVICYLLIALDFYYVLFLDLLAFCSTLVLCVCVCVCVCVSCFQILLVALAFVPTLILQVQVFILGFSFWFLPNFHFLLLFFVSHLRVLPGFHFLFLSLIFFLLALVRFSFLTFIFHFSLMGENTLW